MCWFYRDTEDSSVIVDAFCIKVFLLNFTSGFLTLAEIITHWQDKAQGSQHQPAFFLTPMPQSNRVSRV